MNKFNTDYVDEIYQKNEGDPARYNIVDKNGAIIAKEAVVARADTLVQEGSRFGAKEVNAIHDALNQAYYVPSGCELNSNNTLNLPRGITTYKEIIKTGIYRVWGNGVTISLPQEYYGTLYVVKLGEEDRHYKWVTAGGNIYECVLQSGTWREWHLTYGRIGFWEGSAYEGSIINTVIDTSLCNHFIAGIRNIGTVECIVSPEGGTRSFALSGMTTDNSGAIYEMVVYLLCNGKKITVENVRWQILNSTGIGTGIGVKGELTYLVGRA